MEAVIGSTVKPGDKLLILSNGAYGDRMGNIAEYHGINYDMLAFDETEQVSVSYVDDYLAHNAEITHVSVVHCETTTGVLNPLKEIAHIVKMHGKKLIVDAMSSFGGVPLDVEELGIDFLISSANKCIQGVPIRFYHRPQVGTDALQGCFQISFARYLRSVGNDGKRTWKVAFHIAYPCGESL